MNSPSTLSRRRVRAGAVLRTVLRTVLCGALAAGSFGTAGAIELAAIGGVRFQVPAANLKQIRFRHTLRQQYDFSCGSAALATLLTHHYGMPVTEHSVFEQMYLHGDQNKIRREGFSLLDMKRYLATQGLQADGFTLPLDKLQQAGLPAIVLISDKGYHHFVVVKGLADGRILLGDPSSGTRAMTRQAFDAIWPNKLLFVIHGHGGRQVAFNSVSDWRAAPLAPIGTALSRDALSSLTIPKHGPGDF